MEQQLAFIDDSGDTGFKFNRGSSRHFVIACVIFDNDIDAEFAGVSIKKLKRELGWKPEHEFKFNKNTYDQRVALLKAARKFDLKIRAIVVDKTNLREKPKTGDLFYQFIIKEALTRGENLKNAKIYLDGSGGKDYRRRSASYFRKQLNKTGHRMSEFKMVDSKTDTLIQLADMIAGSIRRKYDDAKTDKNDYYNIIKSKIDELWEYCPEQ